MIRFFIRFYMIILMVDAALSFFPKFSNHEWRKKIKKLSDYSCEPLRKHLPPHLPFDISPVIVIFLLYVFIEIF